MLHMEAVDVFVICLHELHFSFPIITTIKRNDKRPFRANKVGVNYTLIAKLGKRRCVTCFDNISLGVSEILLCEFRKNSGSR